MLLLSSFLLISWLNLLRSLQDKDTHEKREQSPPGLPFPGPHGLYLHRLNLTSLLYIHPLQASLTPCSHLAKTYHLFFFFRTWLNTNHISCSHEASVMCWPISTEPSTSGSEISWKYVQLTPASSLLWRSGLLRYAHWNCISHCSVIVLKLQLTCHNHCGPLSLGWSFLCRLLTYSHDQTIC